MLAENYEGWTQQWLEQGMAKGRQEGRQEASANNLIHVLEARFPGASAELGDRIHSISNVELLEALIPTAATVSSLAVFRDALERLG